jgi:signal transduction histidine kinase
MREEQAKASALAARQALARDMHDVLAHSLGGLVIQLDAVEAQLEAGKTDAALTRLHDARSMAASGLAEARRAVEALRSQTDATASVASADLAAQLIDLVDAHERLDGRIDFEQLGTPVDVTQSVATALRRALQESLSNARKHAPGEPVRVRISWHPHLVTLEVSNPVGADASTAHSSGRGGVQLATTGSGRGLRGMRERFAELPGGRVESGVEDGRFAVRAQAEMVDAEGVG